MAHELRCSSVIFMFKCINDSGFDVHPTQSVQYLGVMLDQTLSFDNQVTNILKSSFAFLRSLYRLRNYLSKNCLLSAVNTFVFSRIDYCNSLLSFCSNKTIKRLQRVQNCLARVVKCLPRRAPTSASIRSLSWLRIQERITFKICCFVHKCIYGSPPVYIKSLVSFPHAGASNYSLRSESSPFLYVPVTRVANSRRAFYFKAPKLWNSLPLFIRQEPRYNVFKRRLKAYWL